LFMSLCRSYRQLRLTPRYSWNTEKVGVNTNQATT